MSQQGKNVLIGLLVIVAIALLLWSLLFLNPRVGNEKQILRVRFANVSGIGKGTRVTFAGKPIGRVLALNPIYDARGESIDPVGKTYFFEVIIAIDSRVVIYDTDEIMLNTTGLFGEKSIAIVPEVPPPGVTPAPITDEVLYGLSSDRIEQTFDEMVKTAKQVGDTFQLINDLLEATDEDLQLMIQSFAIAASEMSVTLEAFNEYGLVPKISCAMERICSLFGRIDQGEGTLGQLMQKDDLHRRMLSVMRKADWLLSDLNQYGLLFHLNKGWQRQQCQGTFRIDRFEPCTIEVPQ